MSISNLFTENNKPYQNIKSGSISVISGKYELNWGPFVNTSEPSGSIEFLLNTVPLIPQYGFIGFQLINPNVSEDCLIFVTNELNGNFTNNVLSFGVQDTSDGQASIFISNLGSGDYTPSTLKMYYFILNPNT